MGKIIIIILIIFLALLSLANLGLLIYVWRKMKGPKSPIENPDKVISDPILCNTDKGFFQSSADHAQKVLSGKIAIISETNYAENKKVINAVNDMDGVTKKLTSLAIIDLTKKNNEAWLRSLADQSGTPLWFIILREAVRKVVPDFYMVQNNSSGKVIALHQQTA